MALRECPKCGRSIKAVDKRVTTSGKGDPTVAWHNCPHGKKCAGGHTAFTAQDCPGCDKATDLKANPPPLIDRLKALLEYPHFGSNPDPRPAIHEAINRLGEFAAVTQKAANQLTCADMPCKKMRSQYCGEHARLWD